MVSHTGGRAGLRPLETPAFLSPKILPALDIGMYIVHHSAVLNPMNISSSFELFYDHMTLPMMNTPQPSLPKFLRRVFQPQTY